jgi:TonB family protein
VYPPEAQAQGLRGIVILELVIDTEGKVETVDVTRSVPPFDDAAVAAVRQWEYEVTKLDGKPVRVRLTVPISFALRLPDVKRQEGIPELRQGAAPVYPQGGEGGADVVAQVTLDAEGRVGEAEVRSGGSPWAEALLHALRTWRFAVTDGRGVLSFRVQAEFRPAMSGQPPRVNLMLDGLQESHSYAGGAPAAEPPTQAPSAPPAAPVEAPATPPPAAAPEATPVPPPIPASEPSQAPAPQEPTPMPTPAQPAPQPTPTAPPAGVPQEPAAEPPPIAGPPGAPPVEIISAPTPPPPPAPPGVSAVANVMLGAGVPDLVRGRRPAPPPLARMSGETGSVVVRFSLDAAGQTSLKSSDGPELLKPAAEDAVRTWGFRRTTTERLHLAATFSYAADAATVLVILD